MSIRHIYTSPKFERLYRKLPLAIKEIAKEKEVVFRRDPFAPQFETHKLHGKERNIWAFSVTRAYRIKFVFLDGGGILFLGIGTHDIYRP